MRRGAGSSSGGSVHDGEGAREAAAQGADVLVAGAVYASPSHPGQAPAGVEVVREAAESGAPVVGIGGITAENAGEVVAAGAVGVAVISEVLGARDAEAAARRLAEAVRSAWERGGRR